MLRRWYLVIFGLLVTGVGSYYVFQIVPVTYEAASSVVLVPPATAVIEGENPYLYMGGLDQALSVLTVRMSSPTVADPILHKRTDLTYTIGKDVSTTGPIMLVTTEAGTEAGTLKILDEVVKVIPKNLKLLQDQLNIPGDARITAMTIVTDEIAKESNKKQLRAILAVAAAGTAVTVLGTGLLDRLIMRRTAKKGDSRDKRTSRGTKGRKQDVMRLDKPDPGSVKKTFGEVATDSDHQKVSAGTATLPPNHGMESSKSNEIDSKKDDLMSSSNKP